MLKLAEMIGNAKKLGVVDVFGLRFYSAVATGGASAKSFKADWPSANVSGDMRSDLMRPGLGQYPQAGRRF